MGYLYPLMHYKPDNNIMESILVVGITHSTQSEVVTVESSTESTTKTNMQ